MATKSFVGTSLRSAVPTKGTGNRQVTRAAVEFYGPDRAKWLVSDCRCAQRRAVICVACQAGRSWLSFSFQSYLSFLTHGHRLLGIVLSCVTGLLYLLDCALVEARLRYLIF